MTGELQPDSQNFAYKKKVQCVMQGKICTFYLSLLGSIMLYDINQLICGKDKKIGVIEYLQQNFHGICIPVL